MAHVGVGQRYDRRQVSPGADAMRLLLIVSCLCLAACGAEPDTATPAVAAPDSAAAPVANAGRVANPATAAPAASPTPATPGAAASRAMLDGYLDAWNRHDAGDVAGFLADDAVVFDSLLGNLSHGRAEADAKVISMYLRAVPDGRWALRGEPVVSANGFSYEWALTGTNLGDWTSYLRGRGQKIDFKGISIVRIKDGRIAYMANYFDTNALGAQAGW
jgi:hypothetical protein